MFIASAVILFILILTTVNKLYESQQANKKVATLESEIDTKNTKIEELETDLDNKEKQIVDLEEKVEQAEPWFEMSKKEQERKIAEEKEKEEKEKAAEEKKAEEERKKKEEKEKKGYDTGITYDQLARTPDDYEGEKVKFSGKVLQVMEGNGSTVQLRMAINDDYDKVIYVEYDSNIVDSRILEDDQITIMGLSAGLLTYESTLGGEITIPAVMVDTIEQ
ncbi:MAG TPA: toxin regulator [Bacillota bacterium]|nr:toxin regulator [Bacillota bacterium]